MVDDDGSLSPIRGSFEYIAETMHAEELRSALDTMASSSKRTGRRSGWTSSEAEADPMEQDEQGSESEKSAGFREHRRAHYDEFRKLKELRREGSCYEYEENEVNGFNNEYVSLPSLLSTGVKDIEIQEKGSPISSRQSSRPPHSAA